MIDYPSFPLQTNKAPTGVKEEHRDYDTTTSFRLLKLKTYKRYATGFSGVGLSCFESDTFRMTSRNAFPSLYFFCVCCNDFSSVTILQQVCP
ncbi:hypothetical protein CEXT_768531 [Caerostris extrusa]|uniref:Uncharacterized protein n=1 Tax=Caerostris extrusa TaxID=172846 RepID=A0AAV4XMN8_CAEEX|nr:hypothetical protein CEXT_768531 [Caerostris extrusa]